MREIVDESEWNEEQKIRGKVTECCEGLQNWMEQRVRGTTAVWEREIRYCTVN